MVWIRLRLDTATLLFVKRPVTIKLKAAVTHSRTWKRFRSDGVCICNQGSHGRSLIAHGGDSEIKETREQIRPIGVGVEIQEAGNDNATCSVQHMSPSGGNRAAGSDSSDPPSLNQNVASSGH